MFNRIRKTVRSFWPGAGSYGPFLPFPGITNANGVQVSENTAPRLAPVYRGLTLISSNIALAGQKIKTSDGRFLEDHPVLDLLNDPFRFVSGHDWLRQLVWIYLQHGNAGAVLVRDGFGEVIEAIPLISSALSMQVTDDGVQYTVAGDDRPYQPEDILHFRCPSPGSTWLWGASPFQLCADALTVLAQQQVATKAIMANNAAPGTVILKHESSLSANAIQNLRDSWGRSVGNPQNSGKPLILQEGMSADTLDPKVGPEYLDQQRWSVADVSRMLGVPSSYLGDTSDTRYTGVSEQAASFVSGCLAIHGGVIAAEITKKLLSPGEKFVFDYSNTKAGSPSEVTNTMVAAVNAGLVSKDEARARMGYGPLPDGLGEMAEPQKATEGVSDETGEEIPEPQLDASE